MNRREFLQCAAVLVSGITASQLGLALAQEQLTYLATAPNYIKRNANLFSEQQRNLVAAIAETIIPRTETPGAVDAGVPQFIELMVADWLSADERAIFMAGLKDIDVQSKQLFGKPVADLDDEKRLRLLEKMETAASDSAWYTAGNIRRAFVSDAPFICQIKELTVWGFFTSEAGASQVLRYDPMPMEFDGDVALGPNESSWANYRL